MRSNLRYATTGQKIDLLAGAVASQIPSYGLSLIAFQDPLHALYFHAANSTVRGIAAFAGTVLGKEECIGLLVPEVTGFCAGTLISMLTRESIERRKNRRLENLADVE